ncbi:MAG: aspartyl-tRNA(Asn)/glutamyl-tRNA (Gln) amidotransferase subunit [Caulobacteraceae bacterium]|nr:aspartyl-tRNA(Asn)/glutamyl-tRNA (Gln) amidotransferase subunit [Caulobacteraceae bacterium]
MGEDLTGLTLADAARKLASREISSLELTEAYLTRTARLDGLLNAYITVAADEARSAAAHLDAERAAGRVRGPLHGVPLSFKDNIDTAGLRTTAGSAVFADRIPTEDAEVVRRLRQAGAVVLAKAGMHEFALGPTSVSTGFGPVRNPWALDRSAGGSSGGSGAAVAAGLCAASIGTDTGGSIRNPAAWCGVVGLKPTYGLAPIRGVIPVVASLDHCGPIARTVEDAAMVLQQMVGHDALDVTSVADRGVDFVAATQAPVSHLAVGLPGDRFFSGVDAEIADSLAEALRIIAGLTAGVSEMTLPATTGYQLIAERDGFHRDLLKTSGERYTADGRARLASASQDHSAYDYIQSVRGLALLRRTIDTAFAAHQLVVLPTMRVMPPSIADVLAAEEAGHPVANGDLTNGAPFNYFGGPAISVPCGFSRGGLPIGLTIAGPPFSEHHVLALAAAYERAAGLGPAMVTPAA